MLLPFFNNALAKHPAWHHSVETLREIGVTVLVAPEVYEPHPAGAAVVGFLWQPGQPSPLRDVDRDVLEVFSLAPRTSMTS